MADLPDSPIDFAGELNPAQLDAATSTDGAHLVVAGAGSGKTRTLVYRVAYLVLQGVSPESILLLTFTRRAAQEMLRRAAALLDDRCRRVAGGTFHGFANLVLRRHARRLDFGERFTILDRSDAADLIGLLRSEGGYDQGERRFPRKSTLQDLFSKRVNTGRSLEDLVEEDYPQFQDDLAALEALERRYGERKRAHNVMDYDDLLVHLRDLLLEHEEVRRRLAATYRYVMIDEYQDTNRLQAQIGALLASEHANLMVVGDDAQSIYSFRGADFRNIMDFPQLFPDCRTVLLEQSYRSTQPILDLGNAILRSARKRYDKRLFSEIEGDEKPVFVRTPDTENQSTFICQRVLELREEGVPLREMAVLSRAAWHTNALEVDLQARNIPFRKFGGLRFVEAAHVKDVCALLKLGTNPSDYAAWLRVLQFFEGIGIKTAQRLADAVVEKGGDLAPLSDPRQRQRRYGKELATLARLLQSLGREPSVSLRLDAALVRYGPWMKKLYDDVKRRQRDLEALRALAERYRDMESFLADIAIDPPELARQGSGTDSEDEWLTLSTVHSAKGLEWNTVFVVHLNAGQFPSWSAVDDAEGYEEERRLLYVAVTRAKRRLFLLKPDQAWQRGAYTMAELSPLLVDLGDLDRLVEARYFAVQWSPEPDAAAAGTAGAQERLERIRGYFGSG